MTWYRMKRGKAESAAVSGAFRRDRFGRESWQPMPGEPKCDSVTSLGPESSADAQEHRQRLRGSLAPLGFRVKYELENGSTESAPGSEAFSHDRIEPGS